jgi:hypothetical protein
LSYRIEGTTNTKKYFVHDASVVGAKIMEIPYKTLYATFEEYLLAEQQDEWNEIMQDYGSFKVNFEDECYSSHSYLTLEELEKVVGGTISESADLVIPLAAAGHGTFLTADTGRPDIIDIEGMKRFFAEKGYEFIPGFGDQQNYFKGPDGMLFGNDYIINLLNTGQL